MKYSANKLNGNVINCGLVNLADIDTNSVGYTLYLPTVSKGQFMRITIMYALSTRITAPNFTIGINGSGTFNDFVNFQIGGISYQSTLTVFRNDFYEFLGMNDGNTTRWICTNKALPRV